MSAGILSPGPGLSLVAPHPQCDVGTAGWVGGRRRRKRWAGTGRDISVLIDVFAVLSIGSGEPFPPGQLQIPLKQVSVSALAQLYRLPEETAKRKLRDLGDTAAPGMAREGTRCWRVSWHRGAVAGPGAMPWSAERSGHWMAQTRGGGEGGIFFSLESFKFHCHDCFYLKKKKKQNKNEKLL